MDSICISFFETQPNLRNSMRYPTTDEDIESNCAYLGTPCSCTFKCY